VGVISKILLLSVVLFWACSSVAEPPEIIYEIKHPDYEEFIAYAKANNIELDSVEVKRNVMLDIEAIQSSVIYPEFAKEHDIEGRVRVKLLVDSLGRALRVSVDSSDNDYLNGSALTAIYEAEYYAAIGTDGETVAKTVTIPLRFKLR
jgi:TonB family protein